MVYILTATHHHRQGGKREQKKNETNRYRRHTAKRNKQHKGPAATRQARESKRCSFSLPRRQIYCSGFMAAVLHGRKPEINGQKGGHSTYNISFSIFPIYEIY